MPRKMRRRRNKQREALSEKPNFEPGQKVMKVAQIRGQNLYSLVDENGTSAMFELPKKLRHVVFIRPGTFVFARPDSTRGKGAVQGDIEVVVLDCFLNALQSGDFWPAAFTTPSEGPSCDKTNSETESKTSTAVKPAENEASEQPAENPAEVVEPSLDLSEEDGSDFEDMSDLLALGRNPNRASWLHFAGSSSEEE